MNLLQKYPHIIEPVACILNMFLFYAFMSNKSSDFFRNELNSKTVKVRNFNIFYIKSNPTICTNICIFIKICYICSILYCFRQIISRVNTIKCRLILIILLLLIILISKFVKGCGGINIFF